MLNNGPSQRVDGKNVTRRSNAIHIHIHSYNIHIMILALNLSPKIVYSTL